MASNNHTNGSETMTLTFKNREYTIARTVPVTPMLAEMGICHQFVIRGKRGATRLYQQFTNGLARTITTSGKVEEEIVTANVWN